MALDIEALVAALSDEAPSGPDLYGDSDRQAIESVFERSISEGGAATSGEIDWAETIDRIVAQSGRTRDLWLPIYLMRAAAHSGRFELVADGAELLARLVEERWADVHPQLDEVGFIGRKTPCESLVRIGDFLGPLQQVPLVSHPRLGRFSGADFIRFYDEGGGAENYGLFRALIEATPPGDLEALVARIEGLRDAIRRVDAGFTANAEGDTATNFQPAYDVFERMRRAVRAVLPAAEAEAGAAAEDPADAGGGPVMAGSPAKGFTGAITSRADVARAIDGICEYYARQEPGSPVPFLLRRAKEWISLDFMAVLEDIAPGSLDDASRILKSQRSDAGDSSSDSGSSGW
jgi:type VI secretion system protein ImpA